MKNFTGIVTINNKEHYLGCFAKTKKGAISALKSIASNLLYIDEESISDVVLC